MERARAGVTLIEFMVVVAIIGTVVASGAFQMGSWMADARVKASARTVADLFQVARSEAIRSGSVHLVVFQKALGGDREMLVVNDGPVGAMNCSVAADEIVHRASLERGVSWGTSTLQSNGALAPEDQGRAPMAAPSGSSFSDATQLATNPATWVAFAPDGIPRLFTPTACAVLGRAGQATGGIYLTNQRRDHAIVLSPLGGVRIHAWNGSSWTL